MLNSWGRNDPRPHTQLMDKNDKFNKLVAKWLKSGKMYFVDCHDEKPAICPVIEFAGGGEPIGNDKGFSWLEIREMAESQGLL